MFLLRELQSDDFLIPEWSLANIDEEAIPALMNLLDSNESMTRRKAIWILGRIEGAPTKVMPALIRSLDDENDGVRARAAFALEQMGSAAFPALPALIRLTYDSTQHYGIYDARDAAILALGKIGPAAEDAVPVLLELTGDPDAAHSAILALGEIRSRPELVVPILIQSMFSNTHRVRVNAIETLGNIRTVSDTVVATLEQIEKLNECSGCRLSAIEALWKINRYLPTGEVLRRMMQEGAISTRLRSARVANRLGFPREWVLDVCWDTIEHEEFSHVGGVGRLFVELANDTSRPSVSLLIEALKRCHLYERAGAAEALGRLGSSAAEALPALESARTDDEAYVRTAARKAIRQIKGDTK